MVRYYACGTFIFWYWYHLATQKHLYNKIAKTMILIEDMFDIDIS